MNIFNKLTIIVASVFFIGLFLYTIITFYTNKTIPKYPKDMTTCPDFWTVDTDGTCIIPTQAPGITKVQLNIGNLVHSPTMYKYTYTTSTPNPKGLLDTNVSIPINSIILTTTSASSANSPISYLSSMNDPGNPLITSVPTRVPIRKPTKMAGTQGPKIINHDGRIPAGWNILKPTNIDFSDPEWVMYGMGQGAGDPYCAIGIWADNEGITWDSMQAYAQSHCKAKLDKTINNKTTVSSPFTTSSPTKKVDNVKNDPLSNVNKAIGLIPKNNPKQNIFGFNVDIINPYF